MSQDNYRYIRLDRSGDLHRAETFDALDDADAIAQISSMHPKDHCELWAGHRLVASLEPGGMGA
ncbi:MAG TPA: hypothetical protein VNR86_06835 [Sphingomicrobium sp.]|nr:hypothetical protein [Sphingomicrobium sp.]